jgi:carboxyl-terminal processing protease
MPGYSKYPKLKFLLATLLAITSMNALAQSKATADIFWNKPEFWQSPAMKTPYKENISDAEKLAGLSKFWSEVKYNFINFHLVPDLDWDKTYLEFIPRVLATKSTFAYYRELQAFSARLKDGHTDIGTPPELDDQFFGKPPLSTKLVEGKVVIERIDNPALMQQGLVIGQEVIAIDGVATKAYAADRVLPYASDSTQQSSDRTVFTLDLLSGAVGSAVALTMKRFDDTTFTVSLPRLSSQERAKFVKRPPPFELKMLDGNIGYVIVNTMSSDAKANEAFARAYPEIAKTDGLIIDLRNNGGGDSDVGWGILAFLIDQPFSSATWYSRNYRPTFRAWNRPQEKYLPPIGENIASLEEVRTMRGKNVAVYKKPVIVLISPRTASAAEDFLVAFKPLKRGLVIGQPTNGSTGQPLMIHLPGGGRARICTKHDTFGDGTPFVGVGVQPDIFVAPTIADIKDGTDSVLAAAVSRLKK